MAEDEVDLLDGAESREPVPAEEACGANEQLLDRPEERLEPASSSMQTYIVRAWRSTPTVEGTLGGVFQGGLERVSLACTGRLAPPVKGGVPFYATMIACELHGCPATVIVCIRRRTGDCLFWRQGDRVRRYPPEILRPALQQIDMLNAARALEDLQSPPGNRLEALKGDLAGFHSIRINRQWRIIFRWKSAEARQVRIVDYHRG